MSPRSRRLTRRSSPARCVQLTPLVRRLTCPNPGVLTGPGTNTYLIGDPHAPERGRARSRSRRRQAHRRDREGGAAHRHQDDRRRRTRIPITRLASRRLKELTGATGHRLRRVVTGSSPTSTRGDGYVVDQTRRLHACARSTRPGHASNHLCWLLEEENLLFSGDHVMAGSTVVISPPDGDMKQYLDSLARVRAMNVDAIAPAHGPRLADADAIVGGYIDHRLERETKSSTALEQPRQGDAHATGRGRLHRRQQGALSDRGLLALGAPAQAARRRPGPDAPTRRHDREVVGTARVKPVKPRNSVGDKCGPPE